LHLIWPHPASLNPLAAALAAAAAYLLLKRHWPLPLVLALSAATSAAVAAL
jgi:hypothetical protein